MGLRFSIRSWVAVAGLCGSPAAARSLYLDGGAGNDAATGLSAAQAWKTLDKINAFTFQPGDSLLFKNGTQYTGQLAPKGSGTTASPAFVGTYGTGSAPLVQAQGQFSEALLLQNV